LTFAVLALLTPIPAAAQPSWLDASLAGSTWREDGRTAPGWSASAAVYPFRRLGIVGDFGKYPDLPLTSRMGGLRVRFPGAAATPFVQFLVGRAPLDDVAIQPGAGVDWHLHRHVAARFAGDIKVAGDDGTTFIGLRLSAGFAFSVGR
jgi:hypothetical protein